MADSRKKILTFSQSGKGAAFINTLQPFCQGGVVLRLAEAGDLSTQPGKSSGGRVHENLAIRSGAGHLPRKESCC